MENRDTMKISIRSILTIVIIVFTCGYTHAQDCVSMYFDSFEDGDELVVQLKVDNFENITITQFAFTYSYLNLELQDVQGNMDINFTSANVFSEIPGYISVSWNNSSTSQTLSDGSVFLEMRFNVVVQDFSQFAIDPNFNNAIWNEIFEEVCFESTPFTANETRTQLIGKLYHDLNSNCIPDPTDLPLSGWTVFIDGGLEKYHRITDAFGNYNVPVEIGSYTIQVIEENELWSSCEGLIAVTVDAAGDILENSFALSPISSSSALEVVVSSSEIKKCFDNVYSVKYKNNGTAVALSSKIVVQIDENLDYVSTNTGNVSINGKTLTFNIGNVKPGQVEDFQIVLNANCDNIQQGQTLCVEANISSSDIVIPPINWGGAVLTTKATCEGDSVAFTIQNIGTEAMTSPLQSIVVEDDVMFGVNEVDLEPQELMIFKHAASGGVYRVLVDQEDGYPLGNYSTDFIEFCNGGDVETYQYVAMFQNNDESPYKDIECQEVRDVSDSNNMSAFPVGYREEHLINQNEDIEYTVYFKNLQADTVRNLYIENVIDESMNIETLVAGSSSHDYTVSVQENRKLKIEFRNIQLPSNETNEFASGGFVKFRISQNQDLPIGTMINSTSVIYFDLEDGIVTNQVNHLVGEEFIEIILNNEEVLLDEMVIAPNPAISSMKIELPSSYKNLSYVLYDTNGRVINAANIPVNVFYIYRDFIPQGMYFLEIRSASKLIGTKKIVFQD